MQRILWSGGFVVVLAACSPSGVEDGLNDPLILELGGDNPRIGPVLRKRGVVQPPRPVPVVEPPPGPEPQPEPPVRQSFREVSLPQGGSIYKLCVDHLGDGNRWREVAELNGWSERETTRLAPGTMVRLPLR